MNAGRDIAIIGGGIAGLTTALAFRQGGARVRVYEQAPAPTEVGAGLQITPNGGRVLAALGLESALERLSVHGQAVVPTDAYSGRSIARFELTQMAGPSYRFVYRPDLIALLTDACVEAGVIIHGDAQAVEMSQNGTVTFADGKIARASLMIGADGLKSKLRARLNGSESPFFTNQVAWRAVIDAPDKANIAQIWMAKGRHVVTYPLPNGRLNIVAVHEATTWTDDGWHHTANPADLQAIFADCDASLRDLFAQVTEVGRWGLFRHDVAAHWVGQNCAILGDAAHPTLPFLAQGANLAIEDAYVLARCCDQDVLLDRGLKKYEALRRPRVIRAIKAANANARNYHLSGPKRHLAHLGLRMIGKVAPGAFLSRLNWLYGFDATT